MVLRHEVTSSSAGAKLYVVLRHDMTLKSLKSAGANGYLVLRHEVDADGKPTHVNGLVVTGGGGGREEEFKEFDLVVAATDVPGIKKLLPENFRK